MSLKLPFTLMHSNTDPEFYGSPSPPLRAGSRILDKIETVDDPNEDPLPFIDDKDSTSDEDEKDEKVEAGDEEKNGEHTGYLHLYTCNCKRNLDKTNVD